MAGEQGFEPWNAGIRIRCLNQLGDSPTARNYTPNLKEENTLTTADFIFYLLNHFHCAVIKQFQRLETKKPTSLSVF